MNLILCSLSSFLADSNKKMEEMKGVKVFAGGKK